ncbi:MAG TPA: hypothetical protein VLI90_07025, partial [Tepidisphaeraceae bacterium]|nr:hypothetical protein [Tepidisphaeraceae bacterium]
LLVIAVAALACVLVCGHTPGVNGPWYWRWRWRRLDAVRFYPSMLAAAVPFFIGQFLWIKLAARRRPQFVRWILLLSMSSSLAMSFIATGLQMQPFGTAALYRTMTDGNANGYLVDADVLMTTRERGQITLDGFLQQFPRIMPMLHIHSRIRPPGVILFFSIFRGLFPDAHQAILVASLAIGILASLSIPATYLLLLELTGSISAGVAAASYLAMCPGFVLFFPAVDTIYPLATVTLALLWLRALVRRRIGYAIAFGLVLAACCFCAFNVLVLGAFFGGLTLLQIRRGARWGWAINCAVAGVVAFVLFWFALWLTTGFDIIATFKQALHQQALFEQVARRPYPQSIPWDVYDFLLGSGWISAVLIAIGWRAWKRQGYTALVLLCLAQPLLVALLKLLQTETARVWLFMQPLLLVPVGLELAGWSPRQRIWVYAALVLITLTIGQNMWMVGWTSAITP